MKKLLFILCIALAACDKEDVKPKQPETGTVMFYSTDYQYRWSITIDNTNYGSVARATSSPQCGDTYYQNIPLSVGDHTLEVFSLSGFASQPKKTIHVSPGCQQMDIR